MKKITIKYWLLALILTATVISAYSQTTVDQKLSVFTNSGLIGGQFVIKYEIKGTELATATTLGSLNADILYDSSVLRFVGESEWNVNFSSTNGYERYVNSNSEYDSHRSIRIMINGLNVNSDGVSSQPGFNVGSNYSIVLKLNFIILNSLSSASLSIKSATNQVGLFTNPGNSPNTFEINDKVLSNPTIIDYEPLPVQLANLNSSVNSNNVLLKWTTTFEQNNDGFKIERKQENSGWTEIGFVKGKGNSNTQSQYSFEDKKLSSGSYNYRIKQIDNNGNFKYYNLNGNIEISLPKKYNLSQNYPNPFNPVTKINYELPQDSRVNLTVYDILGREVVSLVNQEQKAGYYTVTADSKNLASGTYFYRLIAKSTGKDIVMSKKMNVVK